MFSIIVFFLPEMGGYFLEANNFIPADPLKTPEHIAPVWYFTPYYAMLRAVPSFLDTQFWGVLVMGVSVLIFFAMPWLDRSPVKSIRYRGALYKGWLAAFVVAFLILGYLGVVPVTVWGQFAESFPFYGADKATVVARVLTIVYFLFFLLMPWYTARDKTKPVPERVSLEMTTRSIGLLILLAAARRCGRRSRSAAGGADVRLSPAPVNRLDEESLQRGARNFVNYCLTCHTAKYMRYNRLTDLGLTEEQITDNLMFATDKIGETMTVAMTPPNGQAWFGAAPPDLSVESRIRGRDWLYNYLLGFYRDEKSATGWNNIVFPNVGMPHVLWELSGINKLVETEHEDHEKATAAAIAVKGLSAVEPLQGHKYAVLQVAPDVPGTMTRVRVRDVRRRPRELHGLHGRADQEQADPSRDRRAAVPRRAVRLRVLR